MKDIGNIFCRILFRPSSRTRSTTSRDLNTQCQDTIKPLCQIYSILAFFCYVWIFQCVYIYLISIDGCGVHSWAVCALLQSCRVGVCVWVLVCVCVCWCWWVCVLEKTAKKGTRLFIKNLKSYLNWRGETTNLQFEAHFIAELPPCESSSWFKTKKQKKPSWCRLHVKAEKVGSIKKYNSKMYS